MGNYRTAIITDVSQVPEGYVQLVKFANRRDQNYKTIQKALSDAHKNGHIRAVKLMRTLTDAKSGPVYVHRGDAEPFLRDRNMESTAGRRAAATSRRDEDALGDAFCELSKTMITLCGRIDELGDLVQDLTAALQLSVESNCKKGEGHANGVASNYQD